MSRSPASQAESAALLYADAPPLVPEQGVFEGQVAVVGETCIAGTVIGPLRGPGVLRVEGTGSIEGPVECERLESAGRVVGPVSARGGARLGPGAQLEGDLEAASLEVDDAAHWKGRVRIGR